MKRTVVSAVLIGVAVGALGGFETGDGIPTPPAELWAKRNDALTRAKVFREDLLQQTRIDLAADLNAGVVDTRLSECKYRPDEVSGTTPKFDCVLGNGDKVKVKYGFTREIPSEVAATRLLHALGLGADHVSRVETVRCYGCPFQPFHVRSLWELIHVTDYMDKRLDFSRYRDFNNVSVERNLEGEAIEAGPERGWAFFELNKIDPSQGGATRAEVDALRLVAIFLHHWDNKTSNQRLTCQNSKSPDCKHPLAMIQDVGSEFGPKKVSLSNWRSRPVWADHASCTVSMRGMPYDGGTFEDVQISEDGRRIVAARLQRFSRADITALFTAAGFEDVPEWVAAFEDKVRQIAERPVCPTSAKTS